MTTGHMDGRNIQVFSLGIQETDQEVPSVGWHLTYTRCKKGEAWKQKYAYAKSVAFEQMCEK